MSTYAPYNPLDKKHLGESVADALLRSSPTELGTLPMFKGAGIYAIYYGGKHDLYQPISHASEAEEQGPPIYVGKAVPKGARKGDVGLGLDPGTALFSRLNEHAKSIEQAQNLTLSDFFCRFLVVEDIWIPLGESLLISKFAPIWNTWIDGFGNHDPGKGRYNQERSRWDVIHPGRAFALKCASRRETEAQIKTDVVARLRDQFE